MKFTFEGEPNEIAQVVALFARSGLDVQIEPSTTAGALKATAKPENIEAKAGRADLHQKAEEILVEAKEIRDTEEKKERKPRSDKGGAHAPPKPTTYEGRPGDGSLKFDAPTVDSVNEEKLKQMLTKIVSLKSAGRAQQLIKENANGAMRLSEVAPEYLGAVYRAFEIELEPLKEAA